MYEQPALGDSQKRSDVLQCLNQRWRDEICVEGWGAWGRRSAQEVPSVVSQRHHNLFEPTNRARHKLKPPLNIQVVGIHYTTYFWWHTAMANLCSVCIPAYDDVHQRPQLSRKMHESHAFLPCFRKDLTSHTKFTKLPPYIVCKRPFIVHTPPYTTNLMQFGGKSLIFS